MARLAYRMPFQPPWTLLAGSTAPALKYAFHSSVTNLVVRVSAELGLRGIMWMLIMSVRASQLALANHLPLDVLVIGAKIRGMINFVLEQLWVCERVCHGGILHV